MIIAKSMPFELNFINYLNLFYLFRGVQIAKKKPEGQLLMQARRLYCSYPLFLADWIKNIHTRTLISWPGVAYQQVVFVHRRCKSLAALFP